MSNNEDNPENDHIVIYIIKLRFSLYITSIVIIPIKGLKIEKVKYACDLYKWKCWYVIKIYKEKS